MFLKRITLCGFKSFCDEVHFDFGPGITCIVGPNGCGKSNVVDAFKWVLGEQSARSLRGRQMGDMIFNGSSTRRSSGMATVSLVFDNTDHRLPLDFEEVTVSRKLYRSGESEYLLNNEAARLKDIRELFMDTGVGADAYAIIEQGRVDSLLQSSPTDRRTIFEEAAGISKYKARRIEAERKLNRTQQNLLRVEDIIEEVQKRLRSVKLQAGKARNFQEYERRLNELRSSYSLAEYHQLSERIGALVGSERQRTDDITALRTRIHQHETAESQTTTLLDRLVEKISTTDKNLVKVKADLAAHSERMEAAEHRITEQEELMSRTQTRVDGDVERLTERRKEIDSVQQSAHQLQSETHNLQATVKELDEQDRALTRKLAEAQAILEDEKSGIIELLRNSAQANNEITRLNTHRESLVGQKGRLSRRDAELRTELESCVQQRAQLQIRVKQVEMLLAEENAKLEEKKAQYVAAVEAAGNINIELTTARETRSALKSRRDILRDLQSRMDGIGAGVKKILDEMQRPHRTASLETVAGLVADLFEADVAHAPIIEAVLGDLDQCLVVTDSRQILEDRELIDALPGRLHLIGLDRLGPIINERDFSDRPGYVARALDYVRFDSRFEQLAKHFFAKVIVVDSLTAAWEMAESDSAGHRFVTTDGHVVEPDGRFALGSTESQASLISRKSELREVDDRLAEADQHIIKLNDAITRNQAEVTHLEAVQQELRTAIYESSTAKVEASAAGQSIQESIERLTHEQPMIAQEVALLENQITEVLAKSEEGGKSLEAIAEENTQRERAAARHQTRIDDLETQRGETHDRLTEARVEYSQLGEKRMACAEQIKALRRGVADIESAVEDAQREVDQCQSRIADAKRLVCVGADEQQAFETNIEVLDRQATELRAEREGLRQELEQHGQQLKEVRATLTETESKLHESQMALAEATVRRDELAGRIREELDVDLVEQYELYEHREEDWEAVESEIADLRAKIVRLGNVNLDAINELDELQQRDDFLTGQRDDLNASHRQLEQLIDKLNDESLERFLATFELIREHFRGLFRKLFGGGRADIILEDTESPLECGIDIIAQPPGKELQSLSLMSGGEKAMTAIALLMSIFKCRPAPFAILDEVDAALDEANNDRFNRIVQEFVAESQFIVITHSKWTMNIGDHLYGITMQEPGISTRVSVELTKSADVA